MPSWDNNGKIKLKLLLHLVPIDTKNKTLEA